MTLLAQTTLMTRKSAFYSSMSRENTHRYQIAQTKWRIPEFLRKTIPEKPLKTH